MDGWRRKSTVIALSPSDEHAKHISKASSAKEMWNAIFDVFIRHILLNKVAARKTFYAFNMSEGTNALPYMHQVKQLASAWKSMNVYVDHRELAMAVLNGLLSSCEHLIVALDEIGNEDRSFNGGFGESQLSQEEQRSETQNAEIQKSTEDSVLVSSSTSHPAKRSAQPLSHGNRSER